MNIFIINASPKGEKSNTLILTNSFIEGIKEKILDVDLRKINLSDLNIKPCTGCFSCWKTTQGSCFIKDDMDKVIENILWADLIVWSFPLYYFNVPSILKSLIDRQLPMNLPFMQDNENENASGSHPSRYDMTGKKHILISTCGFYSARGNYDSVLSMFDHILGVGKYESIFCGQGELFNIKEVSSRTVPYLQIIKKLEKSM